MFAFIEGLLDDIDIDSCIIDAGGFGINVNISGRCAANLPNIGEHVKLYTYTAVREDAISLYGFDDRNDLKMFKRLISVSGVGPKGALGILSSMDSDSLKLAIISDDAKMISKCQGIGLKTAQKIVIELKDKVKVSDDEIIRGLNTNSEMLVKPDASLSSEMQDAVMALTALGYNGVQAKKAVMSVENASEMDSGAIMSAALKLLF